MDKIADKFPSFEGKINILPTAAKAAGISAGAAVVFNLAAETPGLSTGVNLYRKAIGGFLQKLGGPKFNDPDLRNAGATTLIDFIGACITVVAIGRIGGDRIRPLTDPVRDLWHNLHKGQHR